MRAPQFAASVFFALVSGAAVAQTLCESGEALVFSCPTTKSKVVSVCMRDSSLTYRFGTRQRVELEVRDPGPSNPGAFRYHHYFRYRVDRSSIEVETPGALYEVFAEFEDESGPRAGVRVLAKASQTTSLILCVPGKNSARWPLLEGKVACSEEALNTCTPPAPR